MVKCNDCQHSVPASQWTSHQSRFHRRREDKVRVCPECSYQSRCFGDALTHGYLDGHASPKTIIFTADIPMTWPTNAAEQSRNRKSVMEMESPSDLLSKSKELSSSLPELFEETKADITLNSIEESTLAKKEPSRIPCPIDNGTRDLNEAVAQFQAHWESKSSVPKSIAADLHRNSTTKDYASNRNSRADGNAVAKQVETDVMDTNSCASQSSVASLPESGLDSERAIAVPSTHLSDPFTTQSNEKSCADTINSPKKYLSESGEANVADCSKSTVTIKAQTAVSLTTDTEMMTKDPCPRESTPLNSSTVDSISPETGNSDDISLANSSKNNSSIVTVSSKNETSPAKGRQTYTPYTKNSLWCSKCGLEIKITHYNTKGTNTNRVFKAMNHVKICRKIHPYSCSECSYASAHKQAVAYHVKCTSKCPDGKVVMLDREDSETAIRRALEDCFPDMEFVWGGLQKID